MSESFNASAAVTKMEWNDLLVYGKPGVVYNCDEVRLATGMKCTCIFQYDISNLSEPLSVVEKYKWMNTHKDENFHVLIHNQTSEKALEMMKRGDVVTDGVTIYFMTYMATYPKYNTMDEYIVTRPMNSNLGPWVQCKTSEFVNKFANRSFSIYQDAEEVEKNDEFQGE